MLNELRYTQGNKRIPSWVWTESLILKPMVFKLNVSCLSWSFCVSPGSKDEEVVWMRVLENSSHHKMKSAVWKPGGGAWRGREMGSPNEQTNYWCWRPDVSTGKEWSRGLGHWIRLPSSMTLCVGRHGPTPYTSAWSDPSSSSKYSICGVLHGFLNKLLCQ